MSLQIPCLGGRVDLGSLFDARTSQFLTGVKLWVQEATNTIPTTWDRNVSQSVSIQSGSKFSDRSNHLGMNAHMKLSFLSGTIKAEGSGKYLTDSKTSINSESLTLSYSIQTGFKELHLGPEIMKQTSSNYGAATHVVKGIRLGARAFLVFERERSESDSKADIAGSLQCQIAALKIKLEEWKDFACYFGSGFDADDTEGSESIECRYYGDFKLTPPPRTFKEAFTCLRSFTSQNANFPIQVYLTPLSQLDGKAEAVIRHISDEQLNAAGDYCQVLNDVISAANARLKRLEATPWQVQRDVISEFVRQVQVHKTRLTEELQPMLSAVRDAGDGEAEFVAHILSFHRDSSQFSPHQLQTWLSNKERECRVLQHCADRLTRAGARALNDSCARDRFELEASDKLLVEIFLPKSSYVQHLKDFLVSRTATAIDSGITDTWMIQAESQAEFRESLLVRAPRFLGANQSKSSAFVNEPGDGGQSARVQILGWKDYRWNAFEVPLPPNDLRLSRCSPLSVAKLTWTHVECVQPAEYKVDLFTASQKNRPRLSKTTAKNHMAIARSDVGNESFEAQVSTIAPFGVSEPSSRVEVSSNCSIM